jgi:hypothetical protein
MSLTALLDLKDVKAKFRETFTIPKVAAPSVLAAPAMTKNYSLVGTAFDYLLRFCLQRRYLFAIAKEWIASVAPFLLKPGSPAHKLADQILDTAKQQHHSYLSDGKLTDDLLRSCLLLAQLDPVYRRKEIVPDLGQVDERDILDLRNLISIVPEPAFAPTSVCLLDPTFGAASLLVSGADVDLVLDDALIDIKTTIKPTLKREHFDQIIGYYILYRLAGIDNAPAKHSINRLSIYSARYASLQSFPVHSIASESEFAEFTTWFVARAEVQFGTSFEKLNRSEASRFSRPS